MQRLLFLFLLLPCCLSAQKTKQKIFRLEIYHYSSDSQFIRLNDHFRKAYLPALVRAGITSPGFFHKLPGDTTGQAFYVLIQLDNLAAIPLLQKEISSDSGYHYGGFAFHNTPHNAPAYDRMEIILMTAFSYAPTLVKPTLNGNTDSRIYELRSYESSSENYFRNKVKMFNEGGEVTLFQRLGFNAVFYGEVIAGSRMPNLMYMTSFDNKQARDDHWKASGSDPEWKTLSSNPEYKNNVSHIDITFLQATPYSRL